ncbi:MAG: hypothetical protein ACI4SM_04745 [Candidatus Gastranaerophilaceae bacterium]
MSENTNKTTSCTEQLEQNSNKNLMNNESNISEIIEKKISQKTDTIPQDLKISDEFKQNLANFQILKNSGLINLQQEQNLLNCIIKRAIDENVQQKMQADFQTSDSYDFEKILKDFDSNNHFFNSQARNSVLDYLKNCNARVDQDELAKISKLVETIEKSAIDKYIQQVTHDETIEKLNSVAKQKLQSNAQNNKNDGKNFSIFTREQIGKMTNADFLKYESLIMEQLRKGLIK